MTKVPTTIKYAIRNRYAWPGGYPLFLLCVDGGVLCVACGKSEYKSIADSIRHDIHDGWNVNGADVNWEDEDLYCDHCGNNIECAYPSKAEDTINQ